MPALESKATLTAAQTRAAAWINTNQTALDTARANLQAALRTAWINNTAITQATIDGYAADINRLGREVEAGHAVMSELGAQIGFAL